jgi:Acetyltransferases
MYDLRYATDEDYNFLYELNKISMFNYVQEIWGWEESVQQKFFCDKFSCEKYKIIVYDNSDIGAVSVSKKDSYIFINIIEILPKYQNKGIGTSIINQIITDSKNEDFSRVLLQVFKKNPAKKLYDKLGFSTIDETKTHYVMELKIK